MLATVRNRRGVISGVRPFDGPNGRVHLVDVEYNDGATPLEQPLLWEHEPYAKVLPPGALPAAGRDVLVITAHDLHDEQAMTRHFRRLARMLEGRERMRQVAEEGSTWFPEES